MEFFTTDAHFYKNSTNTNTSTSEGNTTVEPEINIPLLAQNHFFFKASMAVNNYYAWFIIICGFIGNTLSFLVMLQVSLHFKSSNSRQTSNWFNVKLNGCIQNTTAVCNTATWCHNNQTMTSYKMQQFARIRIANVK